jgi:small ligand-binding sensory domain FIST
VHTQAFLFLSSHHAPSYTTVVPALRALLPSLTAVLGCSGYGVAGDVDRTRDADDADDTDAGSVAAALSAASPQRHRRRVPEEEEEGPALSLALACLPGVSVSTWHLEAGDVPSLDAAPGAWADALHAPHPSRARGPPPQFILLAEPTFGKLPELLQGLDFAFPGPDSAKVGGLAASAALGVAGAAPRTLLCSLPRDILPGAPAAGAYTSGVVGLTLVGDIHIEQVVAQGCRPMTGAVYSVREAVRNFILALQQEAVDEASWFGRPCGSDGPPPPPPPPPPPRDGGALSPAAALQRELASLGSEEPPRHVMVAIATDTLKTLLRPADFVARPIRGLNPSTGSLAVGDFVRPGQRVRFLVFDQAGAEADLDAACTELARRELSRALAAGASDAGDAAAAQAPPFGALMFSCAGRGRGLFRAPHRDVAALAAVCPVPIAGFHANGEVGQVGARSHLHMFTAVFGILRHRRWASEQP